MLDLWKGSAQALSVSQMRADCSRLAPSRTRAHALSNARSREKAWLFTAEQVPFKLRWLHCGKQAARQLPAGTH